MASSRFCQSLETSSDGSNSGGGTGGNLGSGTGSQDEGNIACSVLGTYNANQSSTYRYVNSLFDVQYADQSGAIGDYATDTLAMAGATVQNQQFGIGYRSSSSEGVMGIGFPNLEVAVQTARLHSYPNVPQALTDAGLINAPAYSLWLDDINSATGVILFGGVDASRYSGALQPLRIVSESGGQPVEMIVELDGMSVTSSSGQNTTVLSQSIPVLLDSGSTLSYLPSDVASAIYRVVGAQYDSSSQLALCPCSLANSTAAMAFRFAGATIRVAMSEMVLPGGDGDPNSSRVGCTFGVVPLNAAETSGASFALGDTFLRSAYVVYDLSNAEIALAQTNFDAGTADVQEIQSGSGGIPDTTGTAPQPTVGVTGTATAVRGGATSQGLAAPTTVPGALAGLGMAIAIAAL